MILSQLPFIEKVLYPVTLAFLGLPLVDVVDYSIRVTAGVLGACLTVYLIRRAISAKKLDDLNIEIKKLELRKLQGHSPDKTSDSK